MAITLIRAISWFANIIMYLLLARAIISWFPATQGGSLTKIYSGLVKLTEPVAEPCRRLIGKFYSGIFDFSLVLAMILVQVASNIIIKLIAVFFMV